ncbi:MAG: ATP-binding protein [Methylobacter sp.]|nr:MAG: ATP-binding protein [Methylobacter sp.]
MTSSMQKIRPAARLIRTIGQDLIKDTYAAIVELVKNSYDADSSDVIIRFIYREEKNRLLIRIEDHGHGMSVDTIVNKWLVPATDDKLKRKQSENGRILQGRKGIGRFSASILGERILLETTQEGKTTTLILDMEELESTEYLDQLNLEVAVEDTGNSAGTIIEIEKDHVSANDVKEIWTQKQIHKLLVELRSLISPEEVYKAASDQGFVINYDAFEIKLIFQDFPLDEYANREIRIDPFPVLDLYDYRISGTVNFEGLAALEFKNQNIPSLPPEKIRLNIKLGAENDYQYPGNIYVDLRVYDRDPDSLDNIIKRGLRDPITGDYVGKNEAKKILDEFYGVGIYREQFRIRPYGEQSFDWLDLDKKRVQNPSFNIGHNQVIGFVYVRSEENSGLTEKSARDGLVENKAYHGLIFEISQFINQLEVRRFSYREKAKKGGRNRTIDDEINSLFDFLEVGNKINHELEQLDMSRQQRETVGKVVSQALETEKHKKSAIAIKIRDTIAIYQGQATLGKITHVLLHEGRKHIKYLSETIPRIIHWAGEISDGSESDLMEKLVDRSKKIATHTKGLSDLFKKIEPLARTRRSPPKNYNLQSILENSFRIFSYELNELDIIYEIQTNITTATVIANEMDLITVFSNLIENSIYWLKFQTAEPRNIFASIYSDDQTLAIEYSDNGPGFQGDNLNLMFEPGYSMKPDGTGLGLTLAGEAMTRIGGSIEAKHSDSGAVFTIVFNGVK